MIIDDKLRRPMQAALLLLLVTCVASLLVGAGDIGVGRSLMVLFGAGDADAAFTLWQLRLPRTLVGLAVGMALAISGALLQAISRNPLAEPGLLGSARAALWPWRSCCRWASA